MTRYIPPQKGYVATSGIDRGIGRTRTMIIADDMTDQEDPTDLGRDILVTISFGRGARAR